MVHQGGALDDGGEEEEVMMYQHTCFMEREGPGFFSSVTNRELAQDEQVITSL